MSSSEEDTSDSFRDRQLRYRNLLNELEDIDEKKDLGIETVKEVGNILKTINSLAANCTIEKSVDQTDEIFLDCKVLSSSSDIIVKCMNALDISTATYEAKEFGEKLCDFLKEGEDYRPSDILKLLDDARKIIPEIEPYEFVYGSYDLNQVPQPKPKRIIQRAPKEKYAKKEPEKVVSVEKEEQGIHEIVKEFSDVLDVAYTKNGGRPINYYDYVIDTSSFTITVENMFYCSFMVRDGKAVLDLDGSTPTIRPATKNELKQFRDNQGTNYQILTTIMMEDWENFKKPGYLQKHQEKHKKK